MALALIRPLADGSEGMRAFSIELGTNRFYRVAIGTARTRQSQGVTLMAEPVFITPLLGPIPSEQMGHDRIELPGHLFRRNAEWVQMMSYRDEQRAGPAVSRMTLSQGSLPVTLSQAASAGPVQNRPYPAAGSHLSQSMFLEGFLNILQGILPQIGGIVRAVAPQVGGQAGNILQQVGNPDTLRLLADLIGRIGGGAAVVPSSSGAAGNPVATAQSRRHAYGLSMSVRARQMRRPALSKAQIAPALLAALPALAPLLQQVLNPQTLQTIIDAPNRATQTIIDGIMRAANIGLEANTRHLDHLRALNPGTNDEGLNSLLQSMGLALTNQGPGLKYRRTERVRLTLPGLTSVQLQGQSHILFAAGQPMAFDVHVELPKSADGSAAILREPVLELIIKEQKTLRPLVITQYPCKDISQSGLLAVQAASTVDDLAALVAGEDYLACISLVWKARSGAMRGATMATGFRLAGSALFDHMEDGGELVPLNDPARYRDYWHRIWAGRFSQDMRRFEVEAAYRYVAAPPGRGTNGRFESQFRIAPRPQSPKTHEGRLKSGYELSVTELNRLLPMVSPGSVPLGEDIVSALERTEFAGLLSLGARKPVSMRGIPGSAFSIWAYPSVRLVTLLLQKPASAGPNGNIRSLEEQRVVFPVPATLNLVGTRSQ